jgi:taurine dioxygenase/alpha-ketoglutarate-dependent 2,4-dichlorophenoxyacetate dioxygenase
MSGGTTVAPPTAAARAQALDLHRLHSRFAAEVRGLDLAIPLAAATVAALRTALQEHGVLVFRGQSLTADEQIALSRRFGPLEGFPEEAVQKGRAELYNVSNVDEGGRLAGSRSLQWRLLQFNARWHTDSSYRTIPALASILHAIEVPGASETGGQTEYADMLAAYDELPEGLRRRMHGRHMVHTPEFDRVLDPSLPPFPNEKKWSLPPVTHPIVRYHPDRDRSSVYVTTNAGSEVGGMPLDAGRAFLLEIVAFVTEPRFVYRHAWRAGDVVMWDNRRLLHRAIPFDVDRERRIMRRTTVAGSEPVIAPWMIEAGGEARG